MNNAALNINEQTSLWYDYTSFGYMPLYGKSFCICAAFFWLIKKLFLANGLEEYSQAGRDMYGESRQSQGEAM